MSSPPGPQQPYPNDPSAQPGGFPPPGQPQGGFPPPGGQPQPARRGSARRTLITLAVLAVLVVGGIAAGIYFNRNAASSAKVGDCVSQEGTNELEVVPCTDAKADFKVVGRVEDKSQGDTDGACEPFTEAESAYWEGKQGAKGLVLCLGPVS
jgi:hypothetical protein